MILGDLDNLVAAKALADMHAGNSHLPSRSTDTALHNFAIT